MPAIATGRLPWFPRFSQSFFFSVLRTLFAAHPSTFVGACLRPRQRWYDVVVRSVVLRGNIETLATFFVFFRTSHEVSKIDCCVSFLQTLTSLIFAFRYPGRKDTSWTLRVTESTGERGRYRCE